MTEMMLIAALALVVLGPKKLPDLARSIGKGFAEFKRATNELKSAIDLETRAEEDRYKQEMKDKYLKRTTAAETDDKESPETKKAEAGKASESDKEAATSAATDHDGKNDVKAAAQEKIPHV